MADSPALHALLNELAKNRGADFRGYKPASLERRLRKRMAQLNLNTYEEYLERIRSNRGDEINHLLSVVLINVTEFFRDPPAWEALREKALPLLLDRMQPGESFRAWCAGCASGEEVYSLAILLAEHFGPRLSEYDVKIYASDHDEEALNVARRGEYPVERIRRLRPEWREKYFTGSGSVVRVQRELRRLAIFGRSNLVGDAPISHVQLLVCRNVLIYFDSPLQQQVLEKFRYALDDGGILFLGRSESQMRNFVNLTNIDAKWRIFLCGKPRQREKGAQVAVSDDGKAEQYNEVVRHLLENLRSGLIVLDEKNVITSVNQAALSMWDMAGSRLVGGRINDTKLIERCPQIAGQVEQSAHGANADALRFECKIVVSGEERCLEVTVRPMLADGNLRIGTLIYTEDVTPQERLRSTVEELETTAEELHSANEELETTNEELQSTNEELETTNEELQSTNEELETTNEELHSLNEELETTNDELVQRTHDLEEMTSRYAETLAQMPSPLAVVNEDTEIQLWNSAAEELFHLAGKGIIGLRLTQLPIAESLRKILIGRHEGVIRTQSSTVVRGVRMKLASFTGTMNVRFMPVSTTAGRGVLMVFDVQRNARAQTASAPSRNGVKSVAQAKKKPATRTRKSPREKGS